MQHELIGLHIDGINDVFIFGEDHKLIKLTFKEDQHFRNPILASGIKFSACILSSTSDRSGCDDFSGFEHEQRPVHSHLWNTENSNYCLECPLRPDYPSN